VLSNDVVSSVLRLKNVRLANIQSCLRTPYTDVVTVRNVVKYVAVKPEETMEEDWKVVVKAVKKKFNS
jgi:hypothetical protein